MGKAIIPETEIGRKYGRLTIEKYLGVVFTPNGSWRHNFMTRCECGHEKMVQLNSMRSGATKSCGCLLIERRKASAMHGHCRNGKLSPEWRAWRDMLTRATNPNAVNAKSYVGRNIGVCPEWNYGGDKKGFERFLSHIGSKPSPKHSVDRICNDRGYEPGNVRWATSAQQARNRTDNHIVTWNEKTMCLTDACKIAGLRLGAVRDRVVKLGWSLEKALTTPLKPDRCRNENSP